MKHISILVPKGATALGCIEGPHKMFTTVNAVLAGMRKKPAFEVQLVGLSSEAQKYDGAFAVQPDATIDEIEETDLIIIPAVNGDFDKVLEMNKDFLPWIRQQYKGGAEIASLCVGAFILAGTGLLKDRHCTTHWQSANEFRLMFPDVLLVEDRILTDEHGIYTSGGANSFWNLLLHILEKYIDRDMAVFFSKYFAIEIDRHSQSPFIMFKGQKQHEDEPIKKAQEFIEQNYQEKIMVDHLASFLCLGRRNLERRFKKATSNTVAEYIQRVKIEAAKISLESSRENVNEVMYKVGYSDPKAFRLTFKRITGLSPIQYRAKYNRENVAAVGAN